MRGIRGWGPNLRSCVPGRPAEPLCRPIRRNANPHSSRWGRMVPGEAKGARVCPAGCPGAAGHIRKAAGGAGTRLCERYGVATGPGSRLPLCGDRRPDACDSRGESRYGAHPPNGSLTMRRRGIWQNRGRFTRRFQSCDGWQTGGDPRPDYSVGTAAL